VTPETAIARRVVVRGRVQGVGFRFAMVSVAVEARAGGWVRNRVDGAVEAFVQGDPAAVARVIEWCRRGPRAARVSEVEVEEAAVDARLADFAARPTV
jgi:acylphosphatase